jgi:hypothetical protein
MKRHQFLLISGFGLLAIGLPISELFRGERNIKIILSRPETLLPFCDTESILRIGAEYLSVMPEERNKLVLIDNLNLDVFQDFGSLKSRLMNQIENDFVNNLVWTLNGWVISATEARQCALFYILNLEV